MTQLSDEELQALIKQKLAELNALLQESRRRNQT